MAALRRQLVAGLGGVLLWGCAAQPADTAAQATGQNSILVNSSPAPGSGVSGSVDELILHFNPAARLDEVTVAGPGGTMPMMVHAVAETEHYSLPVSGIGPGAYTVNWRATAQGRTHSGSFSFRVSD